MREVFLEWFQRSRVCVPMRFWYLHWSDRWHSSGGNAKEWGAAVNTAEALLTCPLLPPAVQPSSPKKPQTGTSLWPGGWGPLLYSTGAIKCTKAQPLVKDAHMWQCTPDTCTNLHHWTCKHTHSHLLEFTVRRSVCKGLTVLTWKWSFWKSIEEIEDFSRTFSEI